MVSGGCPSAILVAREEYGDGKSSRSTQKPISGGCRANMELTSGFRALPPTVLSLSCRVEQSRTIACHKDTTLPIMAADASKPPVVNGLESSNKALELAIDLPHSPGLRLNVHLTILANCIMLFLTSTSSETGPGAVSMGSFVYALPDVGHSLLLLLLLLLDERSGLESKLTKSLSDTTQHSP